MTLDFPLTTIFSSTYHNEEAFKYELWNCFKIIGFSMSDIMKMPIRDRKFYIQQYNRYAAAQQAEIDRYKSNVD